MQIHQIRQRNLQVVAGLAESLEAVGAAMQRAFGDSKNYANWLSQINIGARKMGTATARKIETAMQLPEGWMDIKQFESPEEAMAGLEAMQIARTLLPHGEAFDSWMKMGRVLVQTVTPVGPHNPFKLVLKPPPNKGTN